MEFHRNSMSQGDGRSTVVVGPTLSEAYKRVRQEFGPEAAISGSRTRTRRKKSGWGTEKVFEVLVAAPDNGSEPQLFPDPRNQDLTEEFLHEVERLEKLVRELSSAGADIADETPRTNANPLAAHLIENGASPGTVDRLLTRFASETGRPKNDRPGALAWLGEFLNTDGRDLSDWTGNHVFLGEHADTRLSLVMKLARSLTEAGRRVLVVSVLPDPDRDEPRLKEMSAEAGHDAAVLRDDDQLKSIEPLVAEYDQVLLDLPGLREPALAEGGPVHNWLANNENFHRHLLLPMDRDFLDLDDLRSTARSWNCDWLAVTRIDRTRRPAKLLELVDCLPLPISLLVRNDDGEGGLVSASGELLLDLILGAGICEPPQQ